MSVKLDFALHPGQLEVFTDTTRFQVLVAGRRWGKSHMACVRASCSALSPLNVKKKPVWIVAPVAPQAKTIFWNLLNDMLDPLIVHRHVNDGMVTLANKVQIGIKGADRPDSLRGVGLYDVVLDEFASMKQQTWSEILRPALADVEGRALFIGTPMGRNWFYDLYEYACNAGDPEWKGFHYQSVTNPFLPPAEVAAARKSMSSTSFRQEFMASFETGGSDLFNREWLKYEEEPVELLPDISGQPKLKPGDWFIAVDLHGFGTQAKTKTRRLDETAISVVKIFDDEKWWVRDILVGRWGVEDTARKILEAIDSVKALNVGIEKGALYNAVQPYLAAGAARKMMPLNIVPLSHENRSKSDRVLWALQGRFEHGKISLRPASWNTAFEDQFAHFPSPLVLDDMMDSLAMVAQLSQDRVFSSFGHIVSEPYWIPQDEQVGV